VFFKYFAALAATAILGPGVGHIVIGKYKKGFLLLLLAAASLFVFFFILTSSIDPESIPKDYSALVEYVKNLLSENSDKMIYMEVPLALIWAYALVDLFADAFYEYKNKKREMTQ